MSKPILPTYRTKNWPAYNKALKDRGSLTIWFNPEVTWHAAPAGKRGRQQHYSDAAIQACLTLKVLFGMPLRQATGFVESLLKLVGLGWEVPDFSTLCRRQKTLSVVIPYQGSKGPLNLLIDSTGIKVEDEGEWNARKHGGPKRQLWRKIHIGIDEGTLETGPSKPLHTVDRLLTTTLAETCCLVRNTLRSDTFQSSRKNMIFALLPERTTSKRINGDVAEWSKALPC